jgi:dTDP-4-amino-4,6-dideoxygalactose transaminase
MEGTCNKHQYHVKTGSNFKIKENQQKIEYTALKKVPDISKHTKNMASRL